MFLLFSLFFAFLFYDTRKIKNVKTRDKSAWVNGIKKGNENGIKKGKKEMYIYIKTSFVFWQKYSYEETCPCPDSLIYVSL